MPEPISRGLSPWTKISVAASSLEAGAVGLNAVQPGRSAKARSKSRMRLIGLTRGGLKPYGGIVRRHATTVLLFQERLRDLQHGLVRLRIVPVAEQDHRQVLLGPAHDHVAEADALARVPQRVAGDAPAVAVARFVRLADDLHVRAEGVLARGVAEQATVVERGVPFGQVVDVRVDAAVAAGGGGEALVGAQPAALGPAVAVGAVGYGLRVMDVQQGVVHVQRREDALLEEVLQRLARSLLHHQPE